ncbi:hypothetical protein [Flexithrix dorotheae]|uniref:hypothetical protein n=1 Tax=Flexithrix dorotheae TaxID=70993 RepID=UPI000362B8F6|nr:hypothetical protein [Flexithrix dorotheae]
MRLIDPLLSLTIILVTIIICCFLTWYYFLKAKMKIHSDLIKNGADSEALKKNEIGMKFPWMKLGIVALGFGVSFFFQSILLSNANSGGSEPQHLSILFICVGASLILAKYIDKIKN